MSNMDEKPEWWPTNERIDYLFDKLEGKADFTHEEIEEMKRITQHRREVAVLDGDQRKYALCGLVLNHLERIDGMPERDPKTGAFKKKERRWDKNDVMGGDRK